MDWTVSPITKKQKGVAWEQLGTSGGGNHFVEFGILDIESNDILFKNIAKGKYVALLSHSGSRGVGNQVATYYSGLAMKLRKSDLPD